MDYENSINKKIKITFEKDELIDCTNENELSANDTRKRVLIVDDDRMIYEMYCVKFFKNGFNSRGVGSGEEAISLIKNGFVPDIMLIDLMMPVCDGFTTFERIKKEKLAPNVITIMLTNKGLAEEVDKAKQLGFHGFIIKALNVPQDVVNTTMKIYEENCK